MPSTYLAAMVRSLRPYQNTVQWPSGVLTEPWLRVKYHEFTGCTTHDVRMSHKQGSHKQGRQM